MQAQEENELYHWAKHQHDAHVEFDRIEEQLNEKTNDAVLVSAVIKRLKKEYYDARHKSGLIKLGTGLGLMLIGFCVTCFNFHTNQSFTVVMYGFTAAGLVLLLWGLYELIG